MSFLSRMVPKSIEGQMFAVLAISILLLLSVLTALDIMDRKSTIEWAESNTTLSRLERMRVVLENVEVSGRGGVLRVLSGCHDGYTLSARRFRPLNGNARTNAIRESLAQRLSVATENIAVGYADLTRDDFSYASCAASEIDLPMTAIVVSVRLQSGGWFNAEVHPHEWHLQDLIARIIRYSLALILVGVFALFFIRKLGRPLKQLTLAASEFADGLKVSPVDEGGPPDLRRAIKSFNTMQQQVADDVKKRTDTLAAISHDLRTPLTALRIRGELVDDDETRRDLVASIDKIDKVIASGLEYLRGESRSEPLREVDLSTLLASECSDFDESGQKANFVGEKGVRFNCRPDALARAVRNLIENANKYGDGAVVDLRSGVQYVDITVLDTGPGIPADKIDEALEPFRRLSTARESQQGGFGLGLAIVDAVTKGHDGQLLLEANNPSGLVATIRLPRTTG